MKTDKEWLDEAGKWMADYLAGLDTVDFMGTLDGMSQAAWKENVEFVAECLKAGIKPTRFCQVLYDAQKDYNRLFEQTLSRKADPK